MPFAERAQELGLKYFLISYADLFGTSRAKLVPAAAFASMSETGAGFAGFASWLDLTPADDDVFAIPDLESLTPLPWKPEVGWLAADLLMNGEPLAQAPRQVLKRSLAKAAARGYEFRTGVECEFFLLTPDGKAPSDPLDTQDKPCYDQQAISRRFDLIMEICDALLQLGWEPYQNDHEDANGQYEINWSFADALKTADRQTFYKFLVRSLAEKHGFRATFMPKPFAHLTGNGCHTHISIWDKTENNNLFYDPDDEQGLSELAYHFTGGLMHSAPALCALTNPTINSYRRIRAPATSSGATWSPNVVSFGTNNRTHMIRIPGAGRIELRLPDGSANPYLSAAAILEAGLEGIQQQRHPGPPLRVNLYEDRQRAESLPQLPDNLQSALQNLDSSPVLKTGLGEGFVASYLKLKQQQCDDFSHEITQWELKNTIDC